MLAARAADLAASYQAAIVESLAGRAERALERTGIGRLALGGGVAANGELRRRLGELDVTLHVPTRALCTDNAAMIASAARYCERLDLPVLPRARRVRERRSAGAEQRDCRHARSLAAAGHHRLLQARLPPLRRSDPDAAAHPG